MKKRNIVIIAAVAVIAVVAIVVVAHGKRKATFKQDYHIEDVSTVTKLFLADKLGNEVTLTRNADSSWTIDGEYEANRIVVEDFLLTLHDIRIRQVVNRAAIPTVIEDLAAHAIKCEVYQRLPRINWFNGKLRLFSREKLSTTYYVGRETPDQHGSYMLREGDKVPVVIHIPGFRGFVTPRFLTEPIKWRSHLIADLNVKQIERVELEIPDMPEESFAVVRNGEGFDFEFLKDHRIAPAFDSARVAQLLSSFTWLNFDEFAKIVPNSFADSCVSVSPKTILRVTSTEGETHEVKSYIKYTNPTDLELLPDADTYEMFDVDRLYAIVDGKDTVLIQYFVFDNILQPASYFMGADVTLPTR